ncbi:MAG: hypothetical protein KBD51_03585 [Candidatus Levybacteria bacterium]|nr:hypothetical protein [Candidatus Levybacteria bacterium]
MKKIKYLVFLVILFLGIYMLTAHYDPIPLNHEAIGLGYNHMMHRIVGILFLVSAVLVFWKWKVK